MRCLSWPKERTRTLTEPGLAEFLLETSVLRDYRDKLVHFLQAVASNVGSLEKTSRNDEFQRWLNDCSGSANKLERFVSKIDAIRTVDTDRPLPKNLRNNLVSIAAIWLFTRNQIDIPELIGVLRKQGMNLEGESGAQVDARAFAFVASMIKSTQKRRFAYFVDWVDRSRAVISSQLNAERTVSGQRQRHIDSLTAKNAELEAELREASDKQLAAETELQKKEAELDELQLKLKHQDIHHGADQSSSRADHAATLEDVLNKVELAKKAMGKEKWSVAGYQLEMIEDKLKEELS